MSGLKNKEIYKYFNIKNIYYRKINMENSSQKKIVLSFDKDKDEVTIEKNDKNNKTEFSSINDLVKVVNKISKKYTYISDKLNNSNEFENEINFIVKKLNSLNNNFEKNIIQNGKIDLENSSDDFDCI